MFKDKEISRNIDQLSMNTGISPLIKFKSVPFGIYNRWWSSWSGHLTVIALLDIRESAARIRPSGVYSFFFFQLLSQSSPTTLTVVYF